MSDSQPVFRILGTAGHIDHGKTSLVRSLTGVDADRLPEEKRRGITIDLGFAWLDLPGVRYGVVDVPGHERFVHNMVAGAAGVDVAMLVVAADDSVMPQTREHLAVLDLLGVRAGLVVLTKVDLVDSETVELVQEELKETLADTFLGAAPVVPVSNATGQGMDDLRRALGGLAAAPTAAPRRSFFRMPIDRSFALEGHGAVVTGTVLSGAVRVGDSVILAPAERAVRIRRLQSHGADVDAVSAGQRAAVNLAGIRREDAARGDELTTAGYLQPTRRLLVELKTLPDARPLRNRQQVRFHIATRETTARVIRGADAESMFAEIRTEQPVLADHGQRFILRQLSPAVTIGGGRILDPHPSPTLRLRHAAAYCSGLANDDPAARLTAFLEEQDLTDAPAASLAARIGVDPTDIERLVDQLLLEKKLVRLSPAVVLSRVRRERLGEMIVVRCDRELKRRQPARSVERSVLLASCRRLASQPVLESLVDDLAAREKLVRSDDRIGLPGRRATLTKNQQKTLLRIIEAVSAGGATPPVSADLARLAETSQKDVEMLARVAVEDGLLGRVGDGLYYSPQSLAELTTATMDRVRKGPATVAELRDLWGVSRKYAVPLCEYFDAQGITQRVGDARAPGPRASV